MSALVERIIAARDTLKRRSQDFYSREVLDAMADAANGLTERDETINALLEALHEGRRAIGDHFAPDDCYATGPVTGNGYRDLVECPACSFISMFDAAIAKASQ